MNGGVVEYWSGGVVESWGVEGFGWDFETAFGDLGQADLHQVIARLYGYVPRIPAQDRACANEKLEIIQRPIVVWVSIRRCLRKSGLIKIGDLPFDERLEIERV